MSLKTGYYICSKSGHNNKNVITNYDVLYLIFVKNYSDKDFKKVNIVCKINIKGVNNGKNADKN